MKPGLLLSFVLMLGTVQAATSLENVPSTLSLFQVRGGTIFIPGWDDRGATSPLDLLRIMPSDFTQPASVYRERLLVHERDVLTTTIRIPESASELVIRARGQAIEDEFPYIKVSATEEGTSTSIPLFEGFIKNVPLEEHVCDVPRELQGRVVRLKVTPTNPAHRLDYRFAYVAYLVFR